MTDEPAASSPPPKPHKAPHKNKSRAPIRPLNFGTLALSVGGLGFLRPAPGTWGSVPPPAIVGVLVLAGAGDAVLFSVAGALMVLSSFACVAWGRYAESRFGLKDAPEVVADETAGVCPGVCAAIWLGETDVERLGLLAGAFVLFRISDIFKPWPARQLEALPYGWGVLIDDVMAGVYSAAALAAIGYFLL